MTRIVLDTVVLVRAILNQHSPCGRLVFQHVHQLELVSSPPLLAELMAVLSRPELVRKSPLFHRVEAAQVLELMGRATVVEPGDRVTFPRDPKDAVFLEVALAARADYLISEDNDLLSLREHEGTRIVTCRQFLELLQEAP